MLEQYLKLINAANVYDVAQCSPLEKAESLSRRLGNTILLKREDTQAVFSFKLRGAYNKIHSLSDAQREQGVITASAGNHAQGVALAATKMGCKALIVMPKTTPDIKVNAVREFGGEVVLHGNTYDDAYTHAQTLASEQKSVFIHPYDDPHVIAGQGTIAKEILEQHPGAIDVIFVPVGGGGLLAGIVSYIKAIKPAIKVIGVEPEDAACLAAALKEGKRTELEQVGIFADGVAVRKIGELPFELVKDYVDEVMQVNTDEICAAIKDIFDDTRSIAEPAGALAVAGVKKYIDETAVNNQTLVAIDSGANMNFDRLRHVAERAELGEQRELIFAVTIAEQPGSFRRFCDVIGTLGITEFNYRYSDPSEAHVFVGVKLSHQDEKQALLNKLAEKQYSVIDLTDNEMAKVHIRYMVGGRTDKVRNEKLYRFQFPERPGALLRFLNYMGEQWNISLFHYRNHGAAYGRVLVGIQLPSDEITQFETFLAEIRYPYWDESKNPAYKLFLS